MAAATLPPGCGPSRERLGYWPAHRPCSKPSCGSSSRPAADRGTSRCCDVSRVRRGPAGSWRVCVGDRCSSAGDGCECVLHAARRKATSQQSAGRRPLVVRSAARRLAAVPPGARLAASSSSCSAPPRTTAFLRTRPLDLDARHRRGRSARHDDARPSACVGCVHDVAGPTSRAVRRPGAAGRARTTTEAAWRATYAAVARGRTRSWNLVAHSLLAVRPSRASSSRSCSSRRPVANDALRDTSSYGGAWRATRRW
jgi:hypothetical protein